MKIQFKINILMVGSIDKLIILKLIIMDLSRNSIFKIINRILLIAKSVLLIAKSVQIAINFPFHINHSNK